ncbi:hypothetical protein [Mannheimia haemolytica]|uniref:hypothetical protein n=1 Tax=Mannheimia haemolytica TaxID=75985 RepID=UPI001CF44F8E|nr:hypothetical protein [Mannheimia haemolytica]MCB4227658.1 hypothetical protein [Mannheimia haemolytica]
MPRRTLIKFIREKKNIDLMAQYIINTDFSFKIYCSLFKLRKNRKRLEIYNEYIFIFHSVTNSSLENIISNISKITDPKKQGRNKNLCFEYIKDIIELNDPYYKIDSEIESELERLRKIRNKIISHLDRNKSQNIRKVLSDLEFRDIRVILDNLLKKLNYFAEIHFCKYQQMTNCFDKNFQPYFFDNRLDKNLSNLYCLLQNDSKRKAKLERFFSTYEDRKATKELYEYIENLTP